MFGINYQLQNGQITINERSIATNVGLLKKMSVGGRHSTEVASHPAGPGSIFGVPKIYS